MQKWIGPLAAIALIAVIGLLPVLHDTPIAETPVIPAELLTADVNTLLDWEATQPRSRELAIAMEAHLATVDIETLPLEEAISLRIRQWQNSVYEGVTVNLSNHRYLIHDWWYPQTAMIELYITYYNALRSEEDISTYLASLSGIAQQYEDLMRSVLDSEAIGAVPPRHILESAAKDLHERAALPATQDGYYTNLSTKLQANEGIRDEQRLEALAEAEAIIISSVQPATLKLADFVMDLASRTSEEIGVWRHENGDVYYSVLLKQYTTTSLTSDEIHDFGLQQVARLRQEIAEAAEDLNLDGSQPLSELYGLVAEETGTLSGEETVAYCRELVDKATEAVAPAFKSIPEAELAIVSSDRIEGGYAGNALNESLPATFSAPAAGKPKYQLPTLTFHETIPGHHLNGLITQQYELPEHRKWSMITACTEGWALYGERLAWEYGAYDDDAYGNLGRLQYEMLRAVRMVVDTGIHAKRWTYDQALQYMIDHTGLDEDYVREQIDRYTVNPGQATAYMVGMLKILDLREHAREQLGDDFNLPEFHNAILQHGDVPLDVLEWIVDRHVEVVRFGA